jgi:hypothetical protein
MFSAKLTKLTLQELFWVPDCSILLYLECCGALFGSLLTHPRLEERLGEYSLLKEPLSAEARATGSTKYVVRIMPPEAVQRTLALNQSVNEDTSTMRRLVTHYEDFKAMNQIGRPDIALFAFVVGIGLQGLKLSTCETYVKLILEGKSREGFKIVGPQRKATPV